jgi:APA family basic amino acid/polyamine antiporter
VAALFVLRHREPAAPRPYKAMGYPIAPAVFTVVMLAIVLNAIYSDPRPSGAGLLVMAAGIPLYWWFSRRHRAS